MKEAIADVIRHRLNLMVFEGLATVLLGIAVLAWPVATLMSIVTILAVFMIARSVAGLIKGILAIKEGWIAIAAIVVSLLGFVFGVFILKNPGVSIIMHILFLAIWFVIGGIIEITYGSTHAGDSKNWLIFSGVLSALAGIVLFFNPVTAGLTLFWVFGVYGLLSGSMLIITSLTLKSELKKEFKNA